MFVYGMTRLGSLPLLLDFETLGPSLSLRSFAHLGSAMLIYGMTCLEFLLSLLDSLHLGLVLI